MIRLFFAIALALLGAVTTASAADTQTALALRVINTYVIPRYADFDKATARQHDAWAKFCKARPAGDKAKLIAAFNDTMDAWEAIEHVRTGPVSLFLRAESIDYWPEVRNATAKGLSALLAGTDPHDLDPDVLAQGSVAAQGLPALERLLFSDVDVAAPRACDVGQAIALNLSNLSNDVLSNWTAADGPRDALADGKAVNGGFADGAEASRLLLTDLMTSFQRMLDLKLLAVRGDSIDAAKPKAAENWRSGRSARNLKINLDNTQAMIDVFAGDLDPAVLTDLKTAMMNARDAFAALPDDIGSAATDETGHGQLDAAITALKAARDTARATLPAKLNITLGFNALDGD